MNLRAALLRQLTDLKKDGVLGGSVILRKTMLDECKGDKFEELLAVFSLIVLKKILAASGNPQKAPPLKTQNLVPLVLSHRKAIQRDLERRKELDLRTRQRQKNIDASIKALSEEAVAWKSRKAPTTPKNADTLKRLVRENWIGDSHWVETILHGVPPTPGLSHDVSHEDDEDDASIPLTDLDSRVREQNYRLARWQGYLKRVQERRRSDPEPTQSRMAQSSSSTRFGRHLDITLSSMSPEAPVPEMKLKMRHVVLLDTLDDHLGSRIKHYAVPSDRPQIGSRDLAQDAGGSAQRPLTISTRLNSRSPIRRTSDASSQDTLVAVTPLADRSRFVTTARSQQETTQRSQLERCDGILGADLETGQTSPLPSNRKSLAERTRESLAQFETPRSKLTRSRTTISPTRDNVAPKFATTTSSTQADGASLADRTRQSMSLLANVLDDNYQPRTNARTGRPRHSKSKSMYIPSQRPKLERAWSEESLASAAKEDPFDTEADYESVFKSRPKLAMSPNLSPSRNSDNLDADLEDALNKLTINSSSPDY